MKKYDLHTHFYPGEFFTLIEQADSDFSFERSASGMRFIAYQGTRFFGIRPAMSDMGLRLEAMDRAGVDVAVISMGPLIQFVKDPAAQAKACRELNDRYAELVAANPDRLLAYGTVPMGDQDEAVAELRRVLEDLRFNGVILPSNIKGVYYDDPRFTPFFEAADAMGLCLFLHPQVPPGSENVRDYMLGSTVGFMYDTTTSVLRLMYGGLLDRYPNIRWHIAHAGGALPWLLERIDNGWRDYAENQERLPALPSTYLKRLYYDTVSFTPNTMRLLRDVVGTRHMVMGTDFPHPLGDIDRGVSTIEGLDIPDEDKADIFQNTALSILNNV
ncbi:amidohydrolase family protein [Spongiactinospora sp. TRM90649]|uniref:amidohydrolase family protein n=1 Tax=Spongiactinospora sp. TRM90649 TaxID=3031114 RepID=UPI0023F9E910|nr:amidohydrolase family protein [Spongiactinospora sp. TRM90649]MDF5756933.1 amidohydrolase family protein [Spongiactinospora sp. TRM90649]